VPRILKDAEGEVSSGRCAAGFIVYEAAPGFDSALRVLAASDNLPLIWFAIFEHAEHLQSLPLPEGDSRAGDWVPDVDETAYGRAIARIRSYIESGDTYQVNYTIRLRASFDGDPYSLFHSLCTRQQGTNSAFIETNGFAICSASPELFFELRGETIRSRPMKGTIARGLTLREDFEKRNALALSEKNRAENVMIVDMIRNDLGRIAQRGSVAVTSLFDVERYPTVFQMTSTVEARTSETVSEVISNLFPCASITGAPKVHTMELIAELESGPRGIYTGTVGQMLPNGDARFNVAIRTAVVDTVRHTAEYGVGGGIVWDSNERSELDECLAKAAVLKPPLPEFDLLETLLWTREGGFFLKARHLARLKESAEYFGFGVDVAVIEARLEKEARNFSSEDHRVRLLLGRSGEISIEFSLIEDSKIPEQLSVGVVSGSVDTGDVFLYHKTTNRARYDKALAACPGYSDVLLVNEKGEVTESTIANVVVEKNGAKFTPPVSSGLLAGTFRAELISTGQISERVVTMRDLATADRICLINSVRGWMEGSLIPPTCLATHAG